MEGNFRALSFIFMVRGNKAPRLFWPRDVMSLLANTTLWYVQCLIDGEPGGILSLRFLTQNTQAAKFQKQFLIHS